MKIWIDITNSPHVNFFSRMINDFNKDHEVLITCRHLANTIDLLDLFNIKYHIVGKHYGQNKIRKTSGFIVRILQLYNFLRDKSIDVAISHSSFYSPAVAKLLGIPSIYINDNEHAAGNRVSFLFADKIMIPEFLAVNKVRRQWARHDKIIKYPGVKEGIYLWDYNINFLGHVPAKYEECQKTIYIRPEPWTAQYYKGRLNFFDDLLLDLKDQFIIILLARGKKQSIYYREAKFRNVLVPENSIRLLDIIANCDLFIGAGGTMTREAAVLGIPTISVYQDSLLDVDRYLIDQGIMVHNRNLDAGFVRHFLDETERREPGRELLDKGKEAYELIKRTLTNEYKKHPTCVILGV